MGRSSQLPSSSFNQAMNAQLGPLACLSMRCGERLELGLIEPRTEAIFTLDQSSGDDDTRSRIAVLLIECAISGRSAVW